MTPEPVLTMFTIYDHPRDYPRHIVVRQFLIVRGQREPLVSFVGCLYSTLDEARRDCQRNGASVCLDREPADDANIVETWLR
jgi:hypothetical protein